jgi:hypothetical protein
VADLLGFIHFHAHGLKCLELPGLLLPGCHRATWLDPSVCLSLWMSSPWISSLRLWMVSYLCCLIRVQLLNLAFLHRPVSSSFARVVISYPLKKFARGCPSYSSSRVPSSASAVYFFVKFAFQVSHRHLKLRSITLRFSIGHLTFYDRLYIFVLSSI